MVVHTLPRFNHSYIPVTNGQAALPAGISGVGGGEALSDRVRGLIALERGGEIALSLEHAANPLVRGGEVALPEALYANHKAEIDKWWPIIRAANIKAE